jgi:hypothetical protein
MFHYKLCERSSKSADFVLPGSGSDIAIVLLLYRERWNKEPGSYGFIVHGLPVLKTPEIPLISGFATDLATPGRMYILTLSMKTYSDVGLKCSIS